MGIVVFKAPQQQKKNHFSEAKQHKFNLMLETEALGIVKLQGATCG